MARIPLRQAGLDLRLLERLLGRWPLVALVLWCAAAAVQEPPFFRLQGLDVAWPSVFAAADMVGLAACVTWASSQPRHIYASAKHRFVDAAAVLLGSLGPHAVVVVSMGAMDLLLGSPTDWSIPGHGALRAVLVWTPMAVLASGLAGSTQQEHHPWLAPAGLAAAFLLLAAIHPVTVVEQVGVGKLLASALATAGSAAWTLHGATRTGPVS